MTYLVNDRTSVYASAGRSFRPNTGADESGRAFDPQRAKPLNWAPSGSRPTSGSMARWRCLTSARPMCADPHPTNANYKRGCGRGAQQGAWRPTRLMANRRPLARRPTWPTLMPRWCATNNPCTAGQSPAECAARERCWFAIREDRAGRGGCWGGRRLVHAGERTGTVSTTPTARPPTPRRADQLLANRQARTRLTLDAQPV